MLILKIKVENILLIHTFLKVFCPNDFLQIGKFQPVSGKLLRIQRVFATK